MAKRKAFRKPTRRRRTHSKEFKREAVKLITDKGLSVPEAARNLGLHPNLLRKGKQQMEADLGDASLTEDDRMEIARLRAELRGRAPGP